MRRRECRKTNWALCYVVALVLIVGLTFGRARADGIDSIRAMPTSEPAQQGRKSQLSGAALSQTAAREADISSEPSLALRVSNSTPMIPTRQACFAETILPSREPCAADGRPESDRFEGVSPEFLSVGVLPMSGADSEELWTWQVLPRGLIFRSYLASGREPRIGSQWVYSKGRDWVWDTTIGARVGLLRYGTRNPLAPRGWELDIEGAAFPRLTLDNQRDMISSDFRFGIPFTHRQGRWESKLAVYHLSSHLADEYIIIHPARRRINYSRDVLTFALGYFPRDDVRLYGECGWAWYADGGSKPWEFQLGIEYSPLYPNGIEGTPFFAINTRLREEVDYGGNMTVQAGWQWRGWSGQRFRVGMQYFNGMSDQYQFFREFEEQIGVGVWYDF